MYFVAPDLWNYFWSVQLVVQLIGFYAFILKARQLTSGLVHDKSDELDKA